MGGRGVALRAEPLPGRMKFLGKKKPGSLGGTSPGGALREAKFELAGARAVYQPNCFATIKSLRASRYVKTDTVLCAAQSHGRMFPANHPAGIWTALTSLALFSFNALVIFLSNSLPS